MGIGPLITTHTALLRILLVTVMEAPTTVAIGIPTQSVQATATMIATTL